MSSQILKSLSLVGLVVALVGVVGAFGAPQPLVTVTSLQDAMSFQVQKSGVASVHVQIWDLTGRSLYQSAWAQGSTLSWPLVTQEGRPVANGVYLYTLTVKDGAGQLTRKVGKLMMMREQVGQTHESEWLLGSPTLEDLESVEAQHAGSYDVMHGTNAYTIQSGNVGLGNASPVHKLDIGIGTFSTANLLRIRKGTATYLRMLNDGRVGIGTASPCAGTKLHVFAASSGVGCLVLADTAIRGDGDIGVFGGSASGNGVYGASSASGTAVYGSSVSGVGVAGASSSGTAVYGSSISGTYIFEGIDTLPNDRRFAVERATGNVLADGAFTGPADFAEMMEVSGLREHYEAGDVLTIGSDGRMTRSTTPYDTTLAGVYSAKPGFVGDTRITEEGIEALDSEKPQNRVPVALLGIVPVKVSAENGAIQPGDLLTTSSTPGHAMKCQDKFQCFGAILGKALEPLASGTGIIQVLVMLR